MPFQIFEPETDEIEILGTRYKRGEIYMFTDQPLVTVEANKNRDIISEEDAKNIAATLPLRPISDEHKDGKMIGIYTDAKYVSKVKQPDGSVKDQVLTSGLLYTKHADRDTIEGFKSGTKSQSIEAVADKAGCTICGKWFDDQREYCNHLLARNAYNAYRKFQGMRATGGGIVDEPAGSGTRINRQAVTIVASHDSLVMGREFSTEERRKLADEGKARPDGSYPIVTVEDLHNAIMAWGRGGATAEDKAHIIKRAKAMECEKELPENWVDGAAQAAEDTNVRGKTMSEATEREVPSTETQELNEAKAALEISDLKAKLTEALAKLTKQDEEIAAIKEEKETLTASLKASQEAQRKLFLITAGVFTEDEWTVQRDTVMAMDEKGVELLASKAKQPARKQPMLQGGVQNPPPPVTVAVKPKLVLTR